MSSLRLLVAGLAAVVLLASARPSAGPGQSAQNPPPTVFRATTTLVEVDVIALDRQSRFVSGLSADDLVLLEDGQPQQIQQFYMVTHATAGGGPSSIAPTLPQTGDRAHRVFVIMFDEGHLGYESLMRVKHGAETFIAAHIGSGDFGGVFANGQMYHGRLTTDRNELLAGIKSASPMIDNRQALLAPFREFPRIPSEDDAVRIEAGGREVADRLSEEACRDDPFSCRLAGGENQVENLIERKARLYVRQARVQTARTLQNLTYVTSHLSRIPGRKTIVLLTEGFFTDESRDLLQLVAAQAARGGTTIYAIDGRGLRGGQSADVDVLRPEMGRSTLFDTGEGGPAILTEGTGGFVVRNIDDVSRAFGLIARDTSTYYVIGYRPDNSVMDGTYRKIEVKARVPGLKLRARKGYVAVALPPMEAVSRGGGRR